MSAPLFRSATLWLALWLAALTAPAATAPFALLHSLFDPGTAPAGVSHQGYSVAVDGDIAVTGVPGDSVPMFGCGAVKVYGAPTGGLLHTLTNPSPSFYSYFGSSLGVSGRRVVVGAYQDDTGMTNAGIAYVFDLDSATPTLPVLTLTNPSPSLDDFFGWAVAISGTRVIVGAYQDDAGINNAGSAYLFDLNSTQPTVPVLTLTNPSPALLDKFGISVALAGARVVVGTPFDNSGAGDAGSVYVYDVGSLTPAVPVMALTNPTPAISNIFGWSVAISDTCVVIGAPGDENAGFDTGRIYVYDATSGTPTVPLLTLNKPNPAWRDAFGISVAISGSRVVAAASTDYLGYEDAGRAYVFDLSSQTPATPVAVLNNPTPGSGDRFGCAISISGGRVVIGAYQDDTDAFDAGIAYLYDLASPNPTSPIATLNAPTLALGDYFGAAVSISGSRLIIGAYGDGTGTSDAGSAYVYDLGNATPTVPVVTLRNPSPANSDYFGWAVGISGSLAVVGAYRDNTGAAGAGSGYVYDLTRPAPHVPFITLTNPSPAVGDSFGSAVAVSGTHVVVGALYDDVGATDAGTAYVYDIASPLPRMPVITLTNPNPAAGDYFGSAVALSGTRVVIGAPYDDAGAANAGSAWVYDLAGPTPAAPVTVLTNPGPGVQDLFGSAVAISGNWVIIGAQSDDMGVTNSGSAFVFDVSSAMPSVPTYTLTNPAPALDDYFGCAVAISGTRVVVGKLLDDFGGQNVGGAYVYDLSSATPTVPIAVLTNPSPDRNDFFSDAVSIDGATIAVGSPRDNTGAAQRGAAFVFGLLPTLNIVSAGPGFATLSWTPPNAPGFVLQQTDSLAPTNWVNAPSGAANPVTVATTNAARFYRVAQP